MTNSSAFQQLDDNEKRRVLTDLKKMDALHRQLERLTGVGRGIIQRIGGRFLDPLYRNHKNRPPIHMQLAFAA